MQIPAVIAVSYLKQAVTTNQWEAIAQKNLSLSSKLGYNIAFH